MLDHVDAIERGEPTVLTQGIKNFCLRNAGKGIVVLVTDLMDKAGYEAGLKYLLSQDMDVYLVHVLSAEEIEPELSGDLRLVDCEDGDEAEVTVSGPLLRRYQETLAAFVDGAREFCTRRGMMYLMARNSLSVEDVMTGYLRTRGLVR